MELFLGLMNGRATSGFFFFTAGLSVDTTLPFFADSGALKDRVPLRLAHDRISPNGVRWELLLT